MQLFCVTICLLFMFLPLETIFWEMGCESGKLVELVQDGTQWPVSC